jgi:hypothetical protein
MYVQPEINTSNNMTLPNQCKNGNQKSTSITRISRKETTTKNTVAKKNIHTHTHIA